ncbi:hypothetical protein FAIPA1_10385 [Frankia sp. AiPs1]|uniref:ABC transporter transmembrane domain-containing protein n=1 Tax=Frankia sp. AiPa1 TaxID=573492 RepID=UPI00202B97E7|nr:ABC transporter transmembrane domain-containing protein [Frankia sp. AiPa1]MCL9758233.1 ABC transporter transmembrane domain-containing protein [Frankia sp. AiPa1]
MHARPLRPSGTHRSGAVARVLRRLRPFARPQRRLFLGATLLLLITTGAQTATVWLFGRVTDDGLIRGSTAGLVGPVAAWLVVALVGAASSYAGHLLQARASGGLLGGLREAMLGRLHVLSPTFFTEKPTGDLMTRFDTDLEAVDDLVGSGMVEAATAVAGVLCFGGAVFWRGCFCPTLGSGAARLRRRAIVLVVDTQAFAPGPGGHRGATARRGPYRRRRRGEHHRLGTDPDACHGRPRASPA